MLQLKKLLLVVLIFFPIQSLLAQEIIKESKGAKGEENFQRHEITFRFGYGFRTAKTVDNSGLSQHINGLKQGPTLKAGYSYFWGPNLGPSLKLSQFWASNETSNLWTETKVIFIGPGISARSQVSSHSMVNATLHLGYVSFQESTSVNGVPVDLSGNTIGLEGDVLVNILLNDYLSLQFGMGYHLSGVGKIKDTEGNSYNLDPSESLNRFDIHSGLKLHL